MKKMLALSVIAFLSASASARSETPMPGPGTRYVAMGSSYAAGAGIGVLVPDTPKRCGRTINNYAHLTAAKLQLVLTDVSCGGATTANILKPWNELPAQIDAVTKETRLVTVTIGGNDVNFVRDLAMALCFSKLKAGASTAACRKVAPPAEEDWSRLEENMRLIAREVKQRAPQARLIFVDYLKVIPDHQSCAALPYEQDQLNRSRATFRRLAALTRRIARAGGAEVLQASRLSKGHEACSAQPWAVGYPAIAAPFHPTEAGHEAVARALIGMLEG